MTEQYDPVVSTVRHLCAMLASGGYDLVAAVTQSKLLSEEQIRSAVVRYSATIVEPPDSEEWVRSIRRSYVDGRDDKMKVVAPLWTAEEGQSKLEMELTLHLINGSFWHAQLDSISAPAAGHA